MNENYIAIVSVFATSCVFAWVGGYFVGLRIPDRFGLWVLVAWTLLVTGISVFAVEGLS